MSPYHTFTYYMQSWQETLWVVLAQTYGKRPIRADGVHRRGFLKGQELKTERLRQMGKLNENRCVSWAFKHVKPNFKQMIHHFQENYCRNSVQKSRCYWMLQWKDGSKFGVRNKSVFLWNSKIPREVPPHTEFWKLYPLPRSLYHLMYAKVFINSACLHCTHGCKDSYLWITWILKES